MPSPFSARTVSFRSGDLTAVAHVTSPLADPDRAVVLVHGVGSSSRAFRRLGDQLAEHAEVHAIDLPGFGAAPHPGREVAIPEFASVVAGYVRRHVTDAGLPAPVLVGHSMGTQVVAQLLADFPDAGSAGVLLGPTADTRARSIPRQAARLAVDAVGEPPRAVGVLLFDALVRCGLPYYLTELRHVVAHRIEDVLPRIEAPVIVVRGDGDTVAPQSWSEWLAGRAPRGELRTVRGRHHAMDRDPEGLAAVVLEASLTSERDVR